MKVSAVLFAATAQVASAHYFFDAVVINGAPTRAFQYIRDFTRPTKFNPIKFSSNPAADIRDGSFADGPDIVCNQGAFSSAGRTDILEVAAGSDVTVRLGVRATMQHPGPGLYYLSRAPGDDVKAYDGSGDWFKIGQTGVCSQSGDFTTDAWCTWDKTDMTATIPAGTPSGEYLLRMEHIGIHRSHVNQPEHFVSCVQIKVTGGGNGTPGPMVKFPGAYKDSDEYANFSIYGGHKPFAFPGPAVWDGSSSGSAPAPPPAAEEEDTTPAPTTPAPTTPAPPADDAPAPAPPSANCAARYGQCGGQGFNGPTCCSAGACRVSNQWYSQCI